MNHEEISEHILAELECSLEELESLENREQLERQGIDVQNDIERYSALIDSFKLMVEKAKAFDQTKEALKEDVEKLEKLEKDFPLSCQGDLENLNNILVLMTGYESGESDGI